MSRPGSVLGLSCILLTIGAPRLSATDRPPTEGTAATLTTQVENSDQVWSRAAIAADHPLASQAGIEILDRGGNVVDAAVAVGFALSVLRPASSGIGGGGFMVIWDAQRQRSIVLDYRERAPIAATRDMFTAAGRENSSRRGGLAVAVPGHVAGLCYALRKYGSLSLPEVLEPALRYARDGVVLDKHEREVRGAAFAQWKSRQQSTDVAAFWNEYLAGLATNDRDAVVTSPQQRALSLIASDGPDAFYHGPIARAVVKCVRQAGGVITLEDMARMDVVERDAVTMTFDDMTVVTMPPPSSGGVALVQSLRMLTWIEQHRLHKPLQDLGHNSPEYIHVLTEAMKHAFADRAEYLGDPDFSDIPVKRLISKEYAAALAEKIQLDRTQPPEAYGRYAGIDDAGTTHFSIIDAHGNAVACTETINTTFGSLLVEPEFGIVLNNEMDDFAARPGEPNAFGLLQSEANSVAPRRKPLSSMTPTVLVRDGRAVYVAGASGGPRIISSTLQVLLNMSRFHMDPRQAVTSPRIHHQWMPDRLLVEPPLDATVRKPLTQLGHNVGVSSELAISQATSSQDGVLRAFADPRKGGRAAGLNSGK